MKQVFGYVRVSGLGQLDGDGFTRQKEAITNFCATKGFRVVRWFEEKAVSGTVEAMDRPAFAEMMSLIGDTYDTVVVERADRLARDLMVSEMIFKEAREANTFIYEASSGEELVLSTADPTRVLIRQIIGALSQWERSSIVKKLRAARQRKREETGRCEGVIPWELTPIGQLNVRDIVHDHIINGFSFQDIAKRFDARKIPGPKGKQWDRVTVFRIFNRAMKNKQYRVGHSIEKETD